MGLSERQAPGAGDPSLSRIIGELQALVGVWSDPESACEPVEQGAVRRFAQAIMDESPFYDASPSISTPYGGPIAPPLFPNHMLRRPLGAPDLVQQRAGDADFDGVVPAAGLAPLAGLSHLAVLNGGSEFEIFRYARHGETVTVRHRYAGIHEKSSSKGVLVVVVIEGEIRTGGGELLLRSRRTLLRRPP